MKVGRKPGFSPSAKTREKMRNAKLGTSLDSETKRKIGESVRKRLVGTSKSPEHRDRISEVLIDHEGRCLRRFEELKAEYPEQGIFFETHKSEILFALQDVRTELELKDLRFYIEISSIEDTLPYQYSSSSIYAAEDAMIALLDAKNQLANLSKVA